MPTTGEHLTRAAQNLEFAQKFDLPVTKYIDWAVTAYFYAALHLVDALLFEKEKANPRDQNPGNHEFRWKFVKSKLYLSGIKNEYRILKEKSENARYELSTFTKLQVERDVIPLYEVIEKHILQQIPEELVGLYHWLSRPKANP